MIMTRTLRLILTLVVMAAAAFGATAQRRVTPVTPPKPGQSVNKPKEFDRTRLAERLDAQGNIILVDTVTGLEFVDSSAIEAAKPRNLYPRWESIDFGVDIWDAAMRLTGQKYGVGSAFARLSIHNRFFPLVEVGFGRANMRPDGANYTFKSPLSPYFKIGVDYNMFYNNSPSYALLVGLRYCYTPFKWSVDNVTVPGSYWDDPSSFDIPQQNYSAQFLEISIGVRVKLIGPISAGWQFRYRSITHERKNAYGEPMYIPGFGQRKHPVSGAFSIIYTIPLNRRTTTAVDNSDGTVTVTELPANSESSESSENSESPESHDTPTTSPTQQL